MSLNNNKQYNFYQVIQDLIRFLNSRNIDLYCISSVFQSQNPDNEYLKVYANFADSHVTAHKPSCQHRPELVSGFGNATERGFWIGMLKKNELSDISQFLRDLAKVFKVNEDKAKMCSYCHK